MPSTDVKLPRAIRPVWLPRRPRRVRPEPRVFLGSGSPRWRKRRRRAKSWDQRKRSARAFFGKSLQQRCGRVTLNNLETTLLVENGVREHRGAVGARQKASSAGKRRHSAAARANKSWELSGVTRYSTVKRTNAAEYKPGERTLGHGHTCTGPTPRGGIILSTDGAPGLATGRNGLFATQNVD